MLIGWELHYWLHPEGSYFPVQVLQLQMQMVCRARVIHTWSIRGMFALRIKAQRPERTAKYVGKIYPEQVSIIPHHMGSEQWAHRQGSKFHSCVHTSTDASKEGLSINNEISNFYTGSLQKAQLSPDFGKSLLIKRQRPVGYRCPLRLWEHRRQTTRWVSGSPVLEEVSGMRRAGVGGLRQGQEQGGQQPGRL